MPCSACLWFLLNFGSVPLSEGYRWVFGFLILHTRSQVSHSLQRELHFVHSGEEEASEVSYPFLCAFFDWLC